MVVIQVLKAVTNTLGIIALADFVSGCVHWAEDSYGSAATPILGKLVIEPNLRHHVQPRELLKNSYWQSSWDLWLIGALMLLAAWGFGFFDWEIVLFVALSVNANQLHKWTHQNRDENGALVWALQRMRILPTQAHHAGHHGGAKNTHYCTVTNFVNPVLDALHVWRRLERAILLLTGVAPRVDPTIKPGDLRLAAIRAARHAAPGYRAAAGRGNVMRGRA